MADIQLGDVPAWIGAGTGVAALFRGISNRRQTDFRAWGDMLAELSGLEADELRRLVEDNPTITEIVSLAWEEAARTASEDKRYLLAKVAAAALRGDSTPGQLEELQFFLRTVTALDSVHVTLLVGVGMVEEENWEDYRPNYLQDRRDAIEKKWPGGRDLMDPALAILEGQALIRGGNPIWTLQPYGRRFLNWLLVDVGGWPPTKHAAGDSAPTATA
jgi:hypothetical protein